MAQRTLAAKLWVGSKAIPIVVDGAAVPELVAFKLPPETPTTIVVLREGPERIRRYIGFPVELEDELTVIEPARNLPVGA